MRKNLFGRDSTGPVKLFPVFLVTRDTVADVRRFAEVAVREMRVPGNQGAVVLFENALESEALGLRELLMEGFAEVRGQGYVFGSWEQDKQISGLFAMFVRDWMWKLPGVKLVVDGPEVPVREDWMEVMRAAFLGSNCHFAGRMLATDTGGWMPVGPMAMHAERRHLGTLRDITTAHWRRRGEVLFKRHGWKMSGDEFPFRRELPVVAGAGAAKAVVASAQVTAAVSRTVKTDVVKNKKQAGKQPASV